MERKILTITVILAIFTLIIGCTGNKIMLVDNPSQYYVEQEIVVKDHPSVRKIITIEPYSEMEIDLQELLVDSLVKNFDIKFEKAKLSSFTQRIKYPKTKVQIFSRYFEDREMEDFRGMKVKNTKVGGYKKYLEVNHQSRERSIYKVVEGSPKKIKLNKKPSWRQSVPVIQVLATNKTSHLIKIPMIGSKGKHFHRILPNQEQQVRAFDADDATLQIYGSLVVHDVNQAFDRSRLVPVVCRVIIEPGDTIRIAEHDLKIILKLGVPVKNNSRFYAKFIAGFSGILLPSETVELPILAGQIVQARVMFFKDFKCQQPIGYQTSFEVYKDVWPRIVLTVPSEYYLRTRYR